MEAKHTPGPWCWRRFGCEPYVLATPDRGGIIILDTAVSKRGEVVPMRMGIMRNAKGRAGIMANATPDHPDARLIAAAPALAEALRRLAAAVAEAIECDDPSALGNIVAGPMDGARAALADALAEYEKGAANG